MAETLWVVKLTTLGYSAAQVDSMEPARAAAIIAKGTPSSKMGQSRPKRKRDRFELQFTCNVCDGPNSHSISRHAYQNGTVVVTCPGCQSSHLVADNLYLFEDDVDTLQEYMAEHGQPVTRLVTDTASAAASAIEPAMQVDEEQGDRDEGRARLDKAARPRNGVDRRRPWRGTKPGIKPLDGITDDQARRIREALRERKRRSPGPED